MEDKAVLSASVWAEFQKAYGADAEKELAQANNSANRAKVRELKLSFPSLSEEVISEVLGQCKWNIDDALVPLFQKVEEQREAERRREMEEQREKLQAERAERKKRAEAEAKTFLRQLFINVPEEKVQQILDENEGDVDATTDQLLHILREEEEKTKQQAEAQRQREEEEKLRRQQEVEREVKVDTLRQRFSDYLSKEEIVAALTQHNWDIRQASNDLLKIVETRKLAQLKRLYVDLAENEIQDALNANGWKLVETMKQLGALQEAKKNAAAQPVPQPTKLNTDVASFLTRSAIIGAELEQVVLIKNAELVEEEKQMESYEIVKQELKEMLTISPENLPGLPGMIPLTPKLIHTLRNKELPVSEEAPSTSAPTGEPAPVTASTVITLPSGEQTNGPLLKLKAEPERVDLGQEVKVEWTSEADTTSSDWIGVYRAGDHSNSYLTWNWIGKPVSQGSLTFTLSEFGEFEFRYFSKSKGSQVLAVSNVVKVGPMVDLSAHYEPDSNSLVVRFDQRTGHVYPNAWIGLYASADAPNNQYRTYEWVANSTDHQLRFKAPKAGTWHFRFFPQKSYIDVARTHVSVTGNDSMTLTMEDGQMVVRATIETVDPALDNVWVGIYRQEQPDNRLYRKYRYVASSHATTSTSASGKVTYVLTFRPCTTPGFHEARLFANKSLDVVCRSNLLRVGLPPVDTPQAQ